MEMTELKVTPVAVPKYDLPQSKHDAAERMSTLICLLGPTQSGATQLAMYLALTVYKGCWSAVHLFSPNCYKDATFAPPAPPPCAALLGSSDTIFIYLFSPDRC